MWSQPILSFFALQSIHIFMRNLLTMLIFVFRVPVYQKPPARRPVESYLHYASILKGRNELVYKSKLRSETNTTGNLTPKQVVHGYHRGEPLMSRHTAHFKALSDNSSPKWNRFVDIEQINTNLGSVPQEVSLPTSRLLRNR